MSRASLGVADCGKRLSIADEAVCRQQDRPECATGSALKGREKDGRTIRPSVLYHISSREILYLNSNIRKMQIPSSRRHILCNPSTQSETNLEVLKGWN